MEANLCWTLPICQVECHALIVHHLFYKPLGKKLGELPETATIGHLRCFF